MSSICFKQLWGGQLEYLAQEMFRIEKKFTSGLCSQFI